MKCKREEMCNSTSEEMREGQIVIQQGYLQESMQSAVQYIFNMSQ